MGSGFRVSGLGFRLPCTPRPEPSVTPMLEAYGLSYHSTLGLRVIKKKRSCFRATPEGPPLTLASSVFPALRVWVSG